MPNLTPRDVLTITTHEQGEAVARAFERFARLAQAKRDYLHAATAATSITWGGE